jgi:hypothetical protein
MSWVMLLAGIFVGGGSVVAYSYSTFETKETAALREKYLESNLQTINESLKRIHDKLDHISEGR